MPGPAPSDKFTLHVTHSTHEHSRTSTIVYSAPIENQAPKAAHRLAALCPTVLLSPICPLPILRGVHALPGPLPAQHTKLTSIIVTTGRGDTELRIEQAA